MVTLDRQVEDPALADLGRIGQDESPACGGQQDFELRLTCQSPDGVLIWARLPCPLKGELLDEPDSMAGHCRGGRGGGEGQTLVFGAHQAYRFLCVCFAPNK